MLFYIDDYICITTRFIEISLVWHQQIDLNLMLLSLNYVSLHTKS
jgi:hypothetical protein